MAFVCGKSNLSYKPLISQENLIISPLHIKHGLMAHYVLALDKVVKNFCILKDFCY